MLFIYFILDDSHTLSSAGNRNENNLPWEKSKEQQIPMAHYLEQELVKNMNDSDFDDSSLMNHHTEMISK